MAISLNEGSYGLLMDPTNGVADVENRELRLLSNYGFLEDPSRMIRATRLIARLGWQMEERTQARYNNAKGEDYMSALGRVGNAATSWNRFSVKKIPSAFSARLKAKAGWVFSVRC